VDGMKLAGEEERGVIYGSVCSGIEAASVAWEPLGWRPAWFAEIDPFACSVLNHRLGATRPRSMPEPTINTEHKCRRAMMAAIRAVMGIPDSGAIINHGDFTQIHESDPIDILVGGTPCQSFSAAGLRGGMADDRGNLALEFLRLAGRLRPRWVVRENVPGVLSSGGGRDFGAFLGGLVELGYGFAYRVLDAQYVRVDGFGRAVPQRRRRVFVVGYLGDWRYPAAALFDRESLSGNPPPIRKSGEGVAGTLAPGAHPGGVNGQDIEPGWPVAHTLRADGFDAGEDGSGRGVPLVAHALNAHPSGSRRIDAESETFVACTILASNGGASNGMHPVVPVATPATRWGVRRLTPVECERLQGFPDGWTDVPHRGKPAKDGPRYKAIGNSMPVNVMRWIGTRIKMVESLTPPSARRH
jgi:DNA (cytosine-5)-methyltransferase 1